MGKMIEPLDQLAELRARVVPMADADLRLLARRIATAPTPPLSHPDYPGLCEAVSAEASSRGIAIMRPVRNTAVDYRIVAGRSRRVGCLTIDQPNN